MVGDGFEIDLTADVPEGFLPIRWVGPDGAPALEPAPANGNGNGHHPGAHANGDGHADGNGNGEEHVVLAGTTLATRRLVTLSSFIPPATPIAPAEPPVITLEQSDDWHDSYATVTVRRALASRGARVLAVLIVLAFAALFAGGVLLWDKVETPPPVQVIEEPVDGVTQSDLVEVQTRLNSLETRISTLVDATGAAIGQPVPAELAYQLAALRSCVASFQHAIDVGLVRGGQFPYCG